MPCVRAQSTASESLAEINGETITNEELNRALGARLSQLEEQFYNLKSRELDALIAQRLLAQEAAKRTDPQGNGPLERSFNFMAELREREVLGLRLMFDVAGRS